MKLMCKCGNIENLKTDDILENYKINIQDGESVTIVCKRCNDIVYIDLKNE